MKPIAALALMAATPLVAGCIIIDEDASDRDITADYVASPQRLGSVFGAEVGAGGVSFLVSSNGCTSEESFELDVEQTGAMSYRVAIERVQADRCDAPVEDGTRVRYDFDALGIPEGADVEIANPVRRR